MAVGISNQLIHLFAIILISFNLAYVAKYEFLKRFTWRINVNSFFFSEI